MKFSTDPELEGKIRDVVGLYLHPPDKAVVLCVDEKPQIQALQRTAPTLPVRPGQPERQTFDYVQHGTTTLFAALGWPPAGHRCLTVRRCRCQHRRPLPLRTIRRLRALGLGRENGVKGIYEYLQTESLELG